MTVSKSTGRAPLGSAVVALLLDLALVLVFVSLGKGQHTTQNGLLGLLITASPFLVALIVATVATAGHRTYARVWPQGLVVWIGTVAIGMVLRVWWGLGGAPTSFVVVTAVVLGVFLLGRRALTHTFTRRRTLI